jgi:hypothetical protein
MVHDEGKKALTHVLENVFQFENGRPLVLALNYYGLQDIIDIHSCTGFEDIDELQYKDEHGNTVPLQGLHAYPLRRIFKHYMLHILEECRRHDDTVKSFCAKCQAFPVKEYDDFQVGSAYAASSNCTIKWATIAAKEYDEFCVSPEYIDSVQETKHDPSFSSIPRDNAIVVKDIGEASPDSKGSMEKIPESTNEFSVMSMETRKSRLTFSDR